MWLQLSLWFVTPAHERERHGDGEQQADDHHQNLLHFVFVVLPYLLALDVSVPTTQLSSQSVR